MARAHTHSVVCVFICRVMWKQISFFYFRFITQQQRWQPQQQQQIQPTLAHKAMMIRLMKRKKRTVKWTSYKKITHVWRAGNANRINKYNKKNYTYTQRAYDRHTLTARERGRQLQKWPDTFFGNCIEAIKCRIWAIRIRCNRYIKFNLKKNNRLTWTVESSTSRHLFFTKRKKRRKRHEKLKNRKNVLKFHGLFRDTHTDSKRKKMLHWLGTREGDFF